MSSNELIDSYISRVRSVEEQFEDVAPEKIEEHHETDPREVQLQQELQAALDKDDKRRAIRAAWELLENDEDNEDIHKLHCFLLSRVGVEERDPIFAFSTQPVIQWVSGVAIAAPMLFLASHFLSPSDSDIDWVVCLTAILVFGIPIWDLLIANWYNYANRYRLLR